MGVFFRFLFFDGLNVSIVVWVNIFVCLVCCQFFLMKLTMFGVVPLFCFAVCVVAEILWAGCSSDAGILCAALYGCGCDGFCGVVLSFVRWGLVLWLWGCEVCFWGIRCLI